MLSLFWICSFSFLTLSNPIMMSPRFRVFSFYLPQRAISVLNVHGRWRDKKDDEQGIAWARAFFEASAPYASSGADVNFMTEEESDRVVAAYGANYDRLAKIKKQYDPENLFHLNQNIRPA
jgi:FAD/FMN-containing dehydrogenase